MSSPAWELQKAVYAKLAADAGLLALLGGARIYDDVPRGAAFPYVTFGPSTTRDWSTGTETGSEHGLTLRAWSKAGGEQEVHQVLEAVRAALHESALTPAGHRLVSLRHETSEALRDPDGETYQGIARFRALTEPQP
ncbi:MAG: DUF3168 domain-containing protein [Hyphomicrobium sp.]|uniref:DUF3168 domain-containing protein n=1 Tax=Hyphomicrobium sp. TaxID=82 RepID=UPI003D1073B7